MTDDNEMLDTHAADDQDYGADLASQLGGGDESFIYEEAPRSQVSRGTLLLFGLAAIAGGVIWFMYVRNGPEAASAASAEAKNADQTITQFLSSGTKNIEQMQQMLRNTEGIVDQFRKYPAISQIPLSQLQTNPFRFRTLTEPTDQNLTNRQRENERNAAVKAVQQLSLRSIMHSETHRACMINNSLYQEGQQVDQFTIERITPDSVIVKTGVYRFELKMQ